MTRERELIADLLSALESFTGYDGYGQGGADDANRGDWRRAEEVIDKANKYLSDTYNALDPKALDEAIIIAERFAGQLPPTTISRAISTYLRNVK